jgi:hypothetical protein
MRRWVFAGLPPAIASTSPPWRGMTGLTTPDGCGVVATGWTRAMAEACRADHPNGIKPPIHRCCQRLHWRRSIGAMDDTRSDALIRRNHELLAAAAKAWSDFMGTVARIDHAESRRGCGVRVGTGGRRLAGTARAERTDPTSITSHRLTTLTGAGQGGQGGQPIMRLWRISSCRVRRRYR